MDEIQSKLAPLNKILSKEGLPTIAFVNPKDCIGRDVNARYMTPEMLDNLTENIKRDGRLESAPLVYKEGKKYTIISGHHRVEAAKNAKLLRIMVMVIDPKSEEEIISKQLSHNAISGRDDDVVLKKMFEEIKEISLKMYSGLQDQIDSIQPTTLSFRAGVFQEFVLAFMPEDVESFDEACEMVNGLTVKSSSIVRIAPKAYYDEFSKTIRKVKKVENIKSNATAVMKLVELAKIGMETIRLQKKELDDSAK